MKCPVDGETLNITERSGIEVDYCPKCRGVWLDRGELDKIIERSSGSGGGYQPDGPSGDYREESRHRPQHKKKRESFLGELFDF